METKQQDSERHLIITPYDGIMATRKNQYKSTATAAAELVDNSIEANASEIDILTVSEMVKGRKRYNSEVVKIAVLDNGDGISEEVLAKCLSLGWGTRVGKETEGLGKFGWGLKGSSISQARRVEVYSWQDINWGDKFDPNTEVNMTFLDIEKIRKDNAMYLEPIVKTKLPKEITKFGYKIKNSKSGTLVVWSDLDQMDLKKSSTLTNRLNIDMCRIYRHYIHGGDFGDKRQITIHELDNETQEISSTDLKPNDPLYLMTPNNLPGHEEEATNVIKENLFSIEVDYLDINDKISKSEVEFLITIAKPETQALLGGGPEGRHYKSNLGISFVRAGREIDLGNFGFFDPAGTQHRWWGIEVRFKPELDDLFGVDQTKQKVNNVRKFDSDIYGLFDEDALTLTDKFLKQMGKVLVDHISVLFKELTGRRRDTRGGSEGKTSPTVIKVNQQLDSLPTVGLESTKHGKNKSEEEKVNEIASILLDANPSDPEMTPTVAAEIAKETVNYKVNLEYGGWGGSLFLDRKPAGSSSLGIINKHTSFYEKFWKPLEDNPDQKGFKALETIMMALIRAEDELILTMKDEHDLVRFREEWSQKIDMLLRNTLD
jgi:hypothetical protein